MKELISNNFFQSFIVVLVSGLLFKFMSKDRDDENIICSDIVVFEIKKNAKLASYVMSFIFIVIFPVLSIKPIINDGNIEFLILNLIFISLSIILLLGIKYEKIIYKNGVFKKQGFIGKTEYIKFDDIVKAKYLNGNGSARVLLYTKNKKKLEINSFQTNFDWVLKEIKIRKIEIYNK